MRLRVAVVYGGRSGEHEVSVRSAQAVISAIDPAKYSVLEFRIDKDGQWAPHPILPQPDSNPDIDVVFPVLHGTFGEDGTVQGLLELADLPYVGAGVLSSSVSMDKDITKRLCQQRGLPVVEYVTLWRDRLDVAAVESSLPYPVFVKPANLGSSVGISKAQDRQSLESALLKAAAFDRKIIVERAVKGRELECSVLGNEQPVASVPCEILPSREFYDYEDKYLLDKTEFKLPADLTAEQTSRVRQLALDCYRAVECEGMARVDSFLEDVTGTIYINEINTIPGFTSISMYPRMWQHSGISYPDLLDRLIELALQRHAVRKATKYSR